MYFHRVYVGYINVLSVNCDLIISRFMSLSTVCAHRTTTPHPSCFGPKITGGDGCGQSGVLPTKIFSRVHITWQSLDEGTRNISYMRIFGGLWATFSKRLQLLV